jgi:hypothetical protein
MAVAKPYTLSVPDDVAVNELTEASSNTYTVGYGDHITLTYGGSVPSGWSAHYTVPNGTITYLGNVDAQGRTIAFTMPNANTTITKDSDKDYTFNGITLKETFSGNASQGLTVESVSLTESNALQAMSAIVGMGAIPVTFTRTFKAGTPSTFCLPFSFTPDETNQGKVYNFGGVENWRVQMNRLKPENSESTVAFTPYAFIPAIPEGKQAGDDVEITFTGTSNITAADITAEGENPHTVDQGNWAFHGTYKRIDWQESYGRWYGFNAADGVFSHCTAGAYFPGLRCYLVYNTPATTRGASASSADVVPTILKVMFNDGDGMTTAIGTIDTNTGNMTIDNDGWYSIDGRKLPSKPANKGLYIHNGKKIVIQ